MSHSRAQNAESTVINRLTQNRESTMNRVYSNSIGMALLTLRNNHLDENADERAIAEFCHDKINELENLAKSPEQAGFKSAIEYMLRVIKEPVSSLDTVTLYQFDGEKYVEQQYVFPLKVVLALVWTAVNDNSKYTQHYNGTDKDRFAEAKSNYPHRLASFLNRLQLQQSKPVCHQGIRNDIVAVLSDIYEGIKILEDADTAILWYLKVNLSAQFWIAFNASEQNPSTRKKLISELFTWMVDSNPTPLLQLSDPKKLILEKLDDVFRMHGSNPKDRETAEKIATALTMLEFPVDPKNHPTLAHIYEILNAQEAVGQTNRNQALDQMQTWLKNQYQMSDEDNRRVDYFYSAYITHRELLKHHDLLMMTGQLSEEECSQWLISFDTHFNSWKENIDAISFTADEIGKIELLNEKLRKAHNDSLSDLIENFFAHWFDDNAHETENNKKRLYNLLIDESIKNKIVLTNETIQKLNTSANEQGVLDLTPYWINRIFLHAILTSPHEWSPSFAELFNQTRLFVAQKFNQAEGAAANQLLSVSYPETLQNQLRYLQGKREELTDEQNPRPENMLLLSHDARTATEWFKIARLLGREKFKSIWDTYALIIQKAVKSGKDLIKLLHVCPAERVTALINALSDNITKIIDGEYLSEYLKYFPEEDRITRLIMLSDRLKTIVKNRYHLTECLKCLPLQDRILFLNMLGNYLKTIVKDDHDLAGCLHYLHEEGQRTLFTLLGEHIKTAIGAHFAECLGLTRSISNKMTLITMLGEHLKTIITDNEQLIHVLDQLPLENRINLITTLGGHIKSIIREEYHLMDLLRELPDENRIDLLHIICTLDKNKIRTIRTANSLYECFISLPEKDRITFLRTYDENKINLVNGNFSNLLDFLNDLPENERIDLITLLGNNISEIVKNTDDLTLCLKSLPKKTHEAVITQLFNSTKNIDLYGSLNRFNETQIAALITCIPNVEDLHGDTSKLRNLLNFNQRKEQLYAANDDRHDKDFTTKVNEFLDSKYHMHLTVNVFYAIRDEFDRLIALRDRSAQVKAMHLMKAGLKLQTDFINAVSVALSQPGNDSKNNNNIIAKIHQDLVRNVRALAKEDFIHIERDPVAAFFKKLLGVLLAASLLFLPLISENYRGFFFDTKNGRAMRKVADDVVNCPRDALQGNNSIRAAHASKR